MPGPIKNASFLRDKTEYLSQLYSQDTINVKIQAAELRSQTVAYTFKLENQTSIETEFTDLFHILQNQKDQDNEVFWLWCYYCACNLEEIYKAYSQKAKEEQFRLIKQKIKDRLHGVNSPKEPEPNFLQYLLDSFLKALTNLATFSLHISKIRDYIAYSNVCRLYWAFCRLTLTTGLNLAKDVGLIDKLDLLLGTHTDVNKIISVFQAPSAVFNVLSVGFFLGRLFIDGGMMLMHTFFPTELEKGQSRGCEVNTMGYLPGAASIEQYRNSYLFIRNDDKEEFEFYYVPKAGDAIRLTIKNELQFKDDLNKKLKQQETMLLTAEEIALLITAQTEHVPAATTAFERFIKELYKRHCNMANDIVWATVNFLSNFNYLVGISGPAAGFLTAGFLTFDVCMAFYKAYLAEQEFLEKQQQYKKEIADYNNPDKYGSMSYDQRMMHIAMLEKQLKELEINKNAKVASCYFGAAAAALLTVGFTATLLVSTPLLIVGGYFLCTIAVAMYLSTSAFTSFMEKSLRLEEVAKSGSDITQARKQFEIARNDFIFTMVKNTVVPIVLIATFAVCWPAAIILSALYLGYELFHAYNQHKDTQDASESFSQVSSDEQSMDITNDYSTPLLSSDTMAASC